MRVSVADYNRLAASVAGYRCAVVLLASVLVAIVAVWVVRRVGVSSRRVAVTRPAGADLLNPDTGSNLVAVVRSSDGIKHVTFPPLGDVSQAIDLDAKSEAIDLDAKSEAIDLDAVRPDSYTLFVSRGVSGDGWLI